MGGGDRFSVALQHQEENVLHTNGTHLHTLCPSPALSPGQPEDENRNITNVPPAGKGMGGSGSDARARTVEKEPSPRIFPNLKSSGFFFRGCGACAACCVSLPEAPSTRASEEGPSMLGQWQLLAPGIASGEQESGWFLTIDGREHEQRTTLG